MGIFGASGIFTRVLAGAYNVSDIVEKHNIVVLEAVAAYYDSLRKEKRTIHAVGDGTFIVDGCKLDRKKMMVSKIPNGL